MLTIIEIYCEKLLNIHTEIEWKKLAQLLYWAIVVSCAVSPGGERIVDIVPEGTELELQLRRGVGQAAHTPNNPHVTCTGVYCA
jgi:hypothetical protein